MGDLYQTSRTTGPAYRARPGLWLHRPRSSAVASGVVAWAGGLALLVILAAGLTRLILGWNGG